MEIVRRPTRGFHSVNRPDLAAVDWGEWSFRSPLTAEKGEMSGEARRSVLWV